MAQLKQRTVHGQTVTLHKRKNPIPEVRDTQYLYEVKIEGTTDEERFTRDDADAAFDQTIADIQRGHEIQQAERQQSGGFGGGLF